MLGETVRALLSLYRECRGRGDTVTLALDSRDSGDTVIVFSLHTTEVVCTIHFMTSWSR